MLDAKLHPLSRKICDWLANPLAAAKITATAVTITGFLIGLLSLPAIASGYYLTGLGFILLNRIADGLDGALARREGPTDRGAFLDISLDFFFYASVPLAFALASPQENALAACLLLLSFIGTGSSFLSLASLTAKRGQTAPRFPKKGLYYIGGLAEGAETIGFFIIICVWPNNFPLAAIIFASLCFATTALRWHWGWQILK